MEYSEITANEDLMREHGLLNRLLLLYEEVITKELNVKKKKIINIIAWLVRYFVEDYHEKTEEKFVFPIVMTHNKEVKDLINELIKQHKVSRVLTNKIIKISNKKDINEYELNKLIKYIQLFVKLYRFHESREDTIVFQLFRKSISKEQYNKYSDLFEKEEDEKLGKHGYTKVLKMVEKLEKELGIYDIGKITKLVEKSL